MHVEGGRREDGKDVRGEGLLLFVAPAAAADADATAAVLVYFGRCRRAMLFLPSCRPTLFPQRTSSFPSALVVVVVAIVVLSLTLHDCSR